MFAHLGCITKLRKKPLLSDWWKGHQLPEMAILAQVCISLLLD
jgi:hypothetical protein